MGRVMRMAIVRRAAGGACRGAAEAPAKARPRHTERNLIEERAGLSRAELHAQVLGRRRAENGKLQTESGLKARSGPEHICKCK
eukprot:6196385-Pleurochrysis_carterae.AAC.2